MGQLGIEGAVRYLTKPIDLDDLRAAVSDALLTPEGSQRRKAQHEARLPLITKRKSDVAQVPIQRAAVADGEPGLTLVGALDFGSMGVTAGDFDNDGNIDLYIGNMYSKAGSRVIGNVAPGTYPEDIMATMRTFVTGSQLHRNKGGLQFEQLGQKFQVAAVGWAYAPAFVDLDNDGWLDLYATAGFVSQDRNQPDG